MSDGCCLFEDSESLHAPPNLIYMIRLENNRKHFMQLSPPIGLKGNWTEMLYHYMNIYVIVIVL